MSEEVDSAGTEQSREHNQINREPTFIAQISDTHVIDPDNHEPLFVPNNERFKDAISSIESETPGMHAILATGDLTNWGRQPQYDALAEMLESLTIPFLPIPGNHDHRHRFRATFPDMPWADAEHASWVSKVNDQVRIIGLDSTNPKAHGAAFDAERENWLTSVLSQTPPDGVQTILAMHHPPFSSEIQWMDHSGFEGHDRLIGVLQDSGISRIFCGHLHRPIQSVVAGIPAQVGISTIWHVALDLKERAGIRLINDPAGYQIHRFQGSASISHVRYIATDTEAYRPAWAEEYGDLFPN